MIKGLHHLTAISGHAQRTYDFYVKLLGLKLVKQTIHYEDPNSLHLYFGLGDGAPGTLITFFVFPGVKEGGVGKGQIVTVGFSIPMESVDFWQKRLEAQDILHKWPQQRGNEVVIYFEDPDGLGIELVAHERDARPGFATKDIPEEYAIRGLHNGEVWLPVFQTLGAHLTQGLGLKLIEEQGMRMRYAHADEAGAYVDILWGKDGSVGIPGTGTFDHLALMVEEEADLYDMRTRLKARGLNPTPIRERTYFRSIYCELVPGVTIELATRKPGFTVDEPADSLGQSLTLPKWQEFRKLEILSKLPPLRVE